MAREGHCRYYLVDEDALPEVFLRVTQARELLDTGRARTVAEAAGRAGISPSAYYTYENSVARFERFDRGRVMTFRLLLRHRRGALSEVLRLLADAGADVLMLNQGVPADGAAPVTILADMAEAGPGADALLARLDGIDGVISAAATLTFS